MRLPPPPCTHPRNTRTPDVSGSGMDTPRPYRHQCAHAHRPGRHDITHVLCRHGTRTHTSRVYTRSHTCVWSQAMNATALVNDTFQVTSPRTGSPICKQCTQSLVCQELRATTHSPSTSSGRVLPSHATLLDTSYPSSPLPLPFPHAKLPSWMGRGRFRILIHQVFHLGQNPFLGHLCPAEVLPFLLLGGLSTGASALRLWGTSGKWIKEAASCLGCHLCNLTLT